MDVDDSSDNDSDYRPELDKDNSDNEDEQRATTAPAFSLTKKRKLDSIFNSMLEEDKSFTTQKISNSVSNISNRRQSGSNDSCNSVRDTVSERKKKKRKKHMANILSQVFGRSEASKLVEHSISEEVDVKSLREASLESLKKIQRKKVVVEKKKFAGEEIAVKRTIKTGGGNMKVVEEKVPESSLDSVLDKLKGPKLISTITKSSIDWDNFKGEEGLEDDLAAAAKDGYLTRKEFLDRCDVRDYEIEKTKRTTKSKK